MRTTITIPDKLYKELMLYSQTKKATLAVNAAIQEWIRLQKIKAIKALSGKLAIDADLDKLKKVELKKLEKMNASRSH